jgi:hypothetical protein
VTDAPYVFLGWGVTAAAVGGYVWRLLQKERRLARLLGDDEDPR